MGKTRHKERSFESESAHKKAKIKSKENRAGIKRQFIKDVSDLLNR